MPRIVVFGATGYTGQLAVEALVARGERPLLAARNRERLDRLAGRLGGLETAVADVARPQTVRGLVERGDVLVSTVGPFTRWGGPAIQAATSAGAHYLDSAGEPGFIREVFERHGPAAEASGCGLVTAFGYDWVPGNLAGALALREAGAAAVRVDIGYFITGGSVLGAASGGTRASAVASLGSPGFAWRDGRLTIEPMGRGLRRFDVGGQARPGITASSSEHFALPRLAPALREVNVYLGWFGPASRAVQGLSLLTRQLTRLPLVPHALAAVTGRFVQGSTGGPDEAARAASGSHVQALAYDTAGRTLARVVLEGPNGYTLTGALLAWGASQARHHGLAGVGALGPVDAFGLDPLAAGCAEAGLVRVTP